MATCTGPADIIIDHMAGGIRLKQLNHFNVRAPGELFEKTRKFYTEVIGLQEGWIPGKADFPVCWLYLGDQPVVHLIGRTADDDEGELGPKSTGWLDHIAFSCVDAEAARQRLDELGVDYVYNEFPGAGIAQFLLRDPVGVQIELNFFGQAA